MLKRKYYFKEILIMINNKHIKIYMAGDSTVQTYDERCKPQAGWGQFIGNYFTTDVEFINYSIGGRSSKSFVKEGRLKSILNVIGQEDYLFIQMGHNDATIDKPERYTEPSVEYKKYLKMYIDGARKYGAIPILITPVATFDFKEEHFLNDFPEYCNSMKEVALHENVNCIDLMTKSLDYYTCVGYDEVYPMFLADHTHFTQKGADIIARIISQEILKMDSTISNYVKQVI